MDRWGNIPLGILGTVSFTWKVGSNVEPGRDGRWFGRVGTSGVEGVVGRRKKVFGDGRYRLCPEEESLRPTWRSFDWKSGIGVGRDRNLTGRRDFGQDTLICYRLLQRSSCRFVVVVWVYTRIPLFGELFSSQIMKMVLYGKWFCIYGPLYSRLTEVTTKKSSECP